MRPAATETLQFAGSAFHYGGAGGGEAIIVVRLCAESTGARGRLGRAEPFVSVREISCQSVAATVVENNLPRMLE